MKKEKRLTAKQKKAIFGTVKAYVQHCEEKREKAETERKKRSKQLNEEFSKAR